MRCHKIEYKILGEGSQIVEVILDPDETVVAEAGMMNYMEEGIRFDTKLGDGSNAESGVFGKLFAAGKRALTGESLFVTHFTNDNYLRRVVGFAAPYPGTIIPLDLSKYDDEIYCQKDAFLCAALGTKLDIALTKRIGKAGFFGGEGFILQKVMGDGMAFLHAGGVVVEKKLDGDVLTCDTGSLVGFTKGIDYDVQLVGGLKSMVFGGEGLCLTKLSGKGTVWLQSMPFPRLAERIVSTVPTPSHKH
jgi:uncharacterized protein (TIGR00266 family)